MAGDSKDYALNFLTDEATLEWLKKPCWSMTEAVLLLQGMEIKAKNTKKLPPDLENFVGGVPDYLERASVTGELPSVGRDNQGVAVYRPVDVIQTAKAGNVGIWRYWESALPYAGVTYGQDEPVKAVSISDAQEDAILTAIRKLKFDPERLPKQETGKRGVKAEVRKEVNMVGARFDKAWQRLRDSKRIKED